MTTTETLVKIEASETTGVGDHYKHTGCGLGNQADALTKPMPNAVRKTLLSQAIVVQVNSKVCKTNIRPLSNQVCPAVKQKTSDPLSDMNKPAELFRRR